MPHDLSGNELKVGDRVLIPCRIKALHLTEEYCNLDLETIQPMYPGDKLNNFTLNSKQIRLENK